MKETFLKYSLVLSTIGTVIFYFLWEKRGRTLRQLKRDAEMQTLVEKLAILKARSLLGTEEYEKAKNEYINFVNVHSDKLRSYGIHLGDFSERNQ